MDQAASLRKLVAKQKTEPQPGKSTCEIVAVVSGTGGVGRSNVTINLAAALARENQRVLILDADEGVTTIDVLLGMGPIQGLQKTLMKGGGFRDLPIPLLENVDLLAASSGVLDPEELAVVDKQVLNTGLNGFDENYNYMIIDTSAGIMPRLYSILKSSDRILLICTADPTAKLNAYVLYKAIFEEIPSATAQILVNNIKDPQEGRQVYGKLNQTIKNFLDKDVEYLGHIVHDGNMMKSISKQKPLVVDNPESPASRNFMEIAGKLLKPSGWAEGKGVPQLFNRLNHQY